MDTAQTNSNLFLGNEMKHARGSARSLPSAKAWPSAVNLLVLILVALVTRVPLLGIAETDSALFVIGARQWLRGGPQNIVIYSGQTCAGYYAVVVALIRGLHLGEQDCVLLMSILSLIGCLGILTFGYLLGERFVGPRASLAAMLLFAFSPGLWWITVEPHPQAVSICFGIAAIWSFCRYLESHNVLFAVGSIVGLAIAMACKNDAVLMVPALFAVVVWMGASWRNGFRAGVVAACAVGLSLVLDRLAAGPTAHPVSAGKDIFTLESRIPGLFDLLREGAPIISGIGIIAALFIFVGFLLAHGKLADIKRWYAVLAVWCLPGYIFWLYIAGNNIRHVVAFGLPLFWLGGKCLRIRYVLACLFLGLLVPPNSNTGMFPSPNVPGSERLLVQKKREVAALANTLSQQSSCFAGSYTNDFMVNALLDLGGEITSKLPTTDIAAAVRMPNGSIVTLTRVNSREKHIDLGSCKSLEYDREGSKVRFLGGEWHLPIV